MFPTSRILISRSATLTKSRVQKSGALFSRNLVRGRRYHFLTLVTAWRSAHLGRRRFTTCGHSALAGNLLWIDCQLSSAYPRGASQSDPSRLHRAPVTELAFVNHARGKPNLARQVGEMTTLPIRRPGCRWVAVPPPLDEVRGAMAAETASLPCRIPVGVALCFPVTDRAALDRRAGQCCVLTIGQRASPFEADPLPRVREWAEDIAV